MEASQFCMNVFHIQDKNLAAEFSAAMRHEYRKKGEYLVREGEILNDIYFLLQGITRGFFYNSKGKDVTDCFAYRYGDTAIAAARLELNIPAPMSIQIMEDAAFFTLPIDVLLDLQPKYPEMSGICWKIIALSWKDHAELKRACYQYDAQQRVKWFFEKYPELTDRVADKYIASFLNMTSQTYSRIKHEKY